MRTRVLEWVVILAFSLVACKDKEKLCEAGDESCEVGDGKCVVGYDGDCDLGQACYAGEGAPKGKPGTCTDGQFDASGKLVAAAAFVVFKERPWSSADLHFDGECFFGCEKTLALYPPYYLGKESSTLLVSVRGPHAETEQLKVAVRGVEQDGCEKAGGISEGRQAWECSFPEGWAGVNTREALELKLWTENTREYPKTHPFSVDTQPLEPSLELEARVKELRYLNGGGQISSCHLDVSVHKTGVGRGWESTYPGAWLSEVDYSSIGLFREGVEVPLPWQLGKINLLPSSPLPPDQWIELPADFDKTGTFEIRATVSAKDLAGNEVSLKELKTPLEF
jgi:hypothetical protein